MLWRAYRITRSITDQPSAETLVGLVEAESAHYALGKAKAGAFVERNVMYNQPATIHTHWRILPL